MHVPGQGGRTAIAPDLGGRQRVGLVVRAEAALLFRDGDPEQAPLVQVAVVLDREFGFAVIGGGAAGEDGLTEVPRGRDDRGLLAIEAKRPGIKDRLVWLDGVDRRCAPGSLNRHDAVTCVAAAWVFRN